MDRWFELIFAELVILDFFYLLEKVYGPNFIVVHFESVHALLSFYIPDFYDTVYGSSGQLKTHIKPLDFDQLILMTLECRHAFAVSREIPDFDKQVTTDRDQLFFNRGELDIPNVLFMTG